MVIYHTLFTSIRIKIFDGYFWLLSQLRQTLQCYYIINFGWRYCKHRMFPSALIYIDLINHFCNKNLVIVSRFSEEWSPLHVNSLYKSNSSKQCNFEGSTLRQYLEPNSVSKAFLDHSLRLSRSQFTDKNQSNGKRYSSNRVQRKLQIRDCQIRDLKQIRGLKTDQNYNCRYSRLINKNYLKITFADHFRYNYCRPKNNILYRTLI